MNQKVLNDYGAVLNSIKDYGIFMLDADGCIQSWNPGAQRISGYTSEDIIGQHFSIFYTQEDKDDGKPARELRIAAAEGKYEEEGWRVRKDGTLFWSNVIISPIFDKDQVLLGYSKVTRDLTERRNAEERLNRSNAELRQRTVELSTANSQLASANKGLEEFASIVSHDLKEPLRKVTTFAGMVLAKEKDTMSETSIMMMHKITDAAHRMNVMIEDILALSMLSARQTKEPEDLEGIVQEVGVLLEERIKETKAKIVTDHLPKARVIKAQFVKLFQNLLSHPWKFGRTYLPPVIHITHDFIKKVEGDSTVDFLQIKVADNGIGFEEQFAETIFNLFTRLHGRTRYEGTGLGLGICKKVTENHGGSIVAHSAPNQGATFIIEIPIQQ